MPEISIPLSRRENEAVKQYAEENGVTEEDAIVRLAMDNLVSRMKTKFKRGEVKPFKSPKSD